MNFLSPEDDFKLRTLGLIQGALAKLAYVVQLRAGSRYEHWGMARTHGETAAQKAIAAAHTEVFLDVLGTPLDQLFRETYGKESGYAGQEDALSAVHRRMRDAAPADMDGATAAHLNFVLESLWLAERSRASIRRAA